MRANLGLMAGTYVTANLSNEPLALRYVYEANVGVKLSVQGHLARCGHFSLTYWI
ncbi:MAG: hypothetical protein U0176_15655 [Bacteroidia bacterium]